MQKGNRWPDFTPPAAGLSRRYRGRFLHRRSHDYPFRARINGKAVKLRDAAHFVQDYDKIVTPKVKHAIANQTYPALFANWQGVSIGDGEVWFSGIDGNDKIKVTAIND